MCRKIQGQNNQHFRILGNSFLGLGSNLCLFWMLSEYVKSEPNQNRLTPSWPLTLDDLERKFSLFTILSWSFLSNLSQIRTFWKSDPRLTFDLGWLQKKVLSIRMSYGSSQSNLSPIRAFWKSDPKLAFELGWPQKFNLFRKLYRSFTSYLNPIGAFWKSDPKLRLQTP